MKPVHTRDATGVRVFISITNPEGVTLTPASFKGSENTKTKSVNPKFPILQQQPPGCPGRLKEYCKRVTKLILLHSFINLFPSPPLKCLLPKKGKPNGVHSP